MMDSGAPSGANGMDPVSLGLAGAGLVAGVLEGIFGGSEQIDPSIKALPYEYEQSMLDNFNKGMEDLTKAGVTFENVTKEYTDRLDLIDAGLSNLLPAAEIQKRLAESSARIAEGLGLSAEQLVSNGFLTQEDIADMNQLKELDTKSSIELAQSDPTIQRERQILTQQLMRKGVTGSALDQALRDFDVTSAEKIKVGKFERGTSLLSTRSGLRQQGFNQATNSLGAVQGELGRIQNIYANQGQIASEKYAAGGTLANFQVGMVGTKQDLYDKLGKFNISDRTKGDLRTGRRSAPGGAANAGPERYYGAESTDSSYVETYANQAAGQSDAEIRRVLGLKATRATPAVMTAYQREASRRGIA